MKKWMVGTILTLGAVLVGFAALNLDRGPESPISPATGAKVDRIEITLTPASGRAASKVVEDPDEVGALVNAFTEAKITDRVPDDEWAVQLPCTYRFYAGKDLIATLSFHGNEGTAIYRRGGTLYRVEYAGSTPYDLYLASRADAVLVNEMAYTASGY
ncbi:hypothetical protein [Gehongia tenuis]|uniref:Uncharacterized protein n=1 Tax=Gehongia tenuis TaxID=2763655 RepID=A0A926D5U1_9FIRM|nr:hypothetical protein [Gehongia tenuis]MBC8531882.1 hypothetical protein [Gehongia tenuis]